MEKDLPGSSAIEIMPAPEELFFACSVITDWPL